MLRSSSLAHTFPWWPFILYRPLQLGALTTPTPRENHHKLAWGSVHGCSRVLSVNEDINSVKFYLPGADSLRRAGVFLRHGCCLPMSIHCGCSAPSLAVLRLGVPAAPNSISPRYSFFSQLFSLPWVSLYKSPTQVFSRPRRSTSIPLVPMIRPITVCPRGSGKPRTVQFLGKCLSLNKGVRMFMPSVNHDDAFNACANDVIYSAMNL